MLGPVCHQIGGRVRSSFLSSQCVNPSKRKFTNMATVDVDCACVAEIVYYTIYLPNNVFSSLVAIRHLDISNNKIQTIHFDLPRSLEYLDLSGNRLISFDSNT